MLKFKVSDSTKNYIEPGQELILECIFWFFVFLFIGGWALGELADYMMRKAEEKIPLDVKLKEASKWVDVKSDVEEIIAGRDFPRADLTDQKDGMHWEYRGPKDEDADALDREQYSDKFHDFYDIDSMANNLQRFNTILDLMLSIDDKATGAAKKLDDKMKSLFKKDELIVEGTGKKQKWDDIATKEIKEAKWPNSPVFQKPVACANKLAKAGDKVPVKFGKLSVKVGKLLKYYEKVKDNKQAMVDIVAYIKMCEGVLHVWRYGLAYWRCFPCINNDELDGSGLTLVDKNGRDITDYH